MAIEFAHEPTPAEAGTLPMENPINTNPPEVPEPVTAEGVELIATPEPETAPEPETTDETQPTSEHKQPMVHVILMPEHLLPRRSDISQIEDDINIEHDPHVHVKVISQSIQDLYAVRWTSVISDDISKAIFKTAEPIIVQKYIEQAIDRCVTRNGTVEYLYIILGVSMDCLSSDYAINADRITAIILNNNLVDTKISYQERVSKNVKRAARKKEKEYARDHKISKSEKRQYRRRQYLNLCSALSGIDDAVTAIADKLRTFANSGVNQNVCQTENIIVCSYSRVRRLIQRIIETDIDIDMV